ncbi:MAG: diguanylate cyclase [bacterium]|nr:diguanylate cyclase [bacterium]
MWSRVRETCRAEGGGAADARRGAAGIALLGQVASDGVRSGGNRSVSRWWRWGKSRLRRTPAGPEAGSGRGGEDNWTFDGELRAESGRSTELNGGGIALQSMVSAYQQFDSWLEVHRYSDDPWADFEEYVRSVLFQWVGGTRVRAYRVLSKGDELIPLREMELGPEVSGKAMLSARRGVEGYVATTGRSFVAGDPTHGMLVERLSSAHSDSGAGSEPGPGGPVWCFAIVRASHKVGVVAVHDFAAGSGGGIKGAAASTPHRFSPSQLRLVELVVGQFWNTLTEVCRSRTAVTTDPSSGGLTRKAFFEVGREVLADAHRKGEPVVVAVIGMEGLRRLDDMGHWETTDDLRSTVSRVLRERMRAEDRLGRFDDSRFVLLLRRVDTELGTLIVKELMGRMECVLAARQDCGQGAELRCGLAGSGVTGEEDPLTRRSLEQLVTVALESCQEARQAAVALSSDLASASCVGETDGR